MQTASGNCVFLLEQTFFRSASDLPSQGNLRLSVSTICFSFSWFVILPVLYNSFGDPCYPCGWKAPFPYSFQITFWSFLLDAWKPLFAPCRRSHHCQCFLVVPHACTAPHRYRTLQVFIFRWCLHRGRKCLLKILFADVIQPIPPWTFVLTAPCVAGVGTAVRLDVRIWPRPQVGGDERSFCLSASLQIKAPHWVFRRSADRRWDGRYMGCPGVCTVHTRFTFSAFTCFGQWRTRQIYSNNEHFHMFKIINVTSYLPLRAGRHEISRPVNTDNDLVKVRKQPQRASEMESERRTRIRRMPFRSMVLISASILSSRYGQRSPPVNTPRLKFSVCASWTKSLQCVRAFRHRFIPPLA